MSVEIHTPITEEAAAILQVGDTVTITGYILCGRDAVLPKVIKMVKEGKVDGLGISLQGNVIFHTAVSPAGVGPTSSNKLEIESSMDPWNVNTNIGARGACDLVRTLQAQSSTEYWQGLRKG